jgi:ferredoxin-NADP reductase
MNHEISILSKEPLTHDVIQFRFERPKGYEFRAGQAIELMLHQPGMGPAPFTFTALNSKPYLELTIKIYKEQNGLTLALSQLNIGDKVLITDPWDSFHNKGPGVFIAGGAGITPFIALLRQMQVDNTVGKSWLFFSNKTHDDIFMHDELKQILGDRYVDVITRDKNSNNTHRIDEVFLRKNITDFKQPFYVCGPPGFTEVIQQTLVKIGAAEQMVNISL